MVGLPEHEVWTWGVPSALVTAKLFCWRCETCTNVSYISTETWPDPALKVTPENLQQI